ncbi:MAG: NADH-quinone oxidoreductase subunit A [Fibrobacteres bacterium]|nr:NADH-quinone oxidoreductase subunit A [Fibrobacterota bacterium]
MLSEYLPFILYGILVVLTGVGAIAASSFLGPKKTYSKVKFEPYECGVDQVDNPHRPFALKFYTFALLFILFDIETIFLLPWALGFKHLLHTGTLPAVLFFLVILGMGLFYIIKTRALEWE